jgi:hypothetical protein
VFYSGTLGAQGGSMLLGRQLNAARVVPRKLKFRPLPAKIDFGWKKKKPQQQQQPRLNKHGVVVKPPRGPSQKNKKPKGSVKLAGHGIDFNVS